MEENEIPVCDAAKIEASLMSKESKVYAAKKLSKWLEMDVCVKIFGITVFSWHFPPSE